MASAWSHMIDTIAVEGVINKAIAAVAKVSRTRWNGSLVKSAERIANNEHHGIALEPMTIGIGAQNINGKPVNRWDDHLADWGAVNPYLSVNTEWRATPLCQMHKSTMMLGEGVDHQTGLPHAAGWREKSVEYTLAESFDVNRILIARDIFKHSESVDKYRFRSTPSLMVFISETAALIGAVANWIFAYYGITLTGTGYTVWIGTYPITSMSTARLTH